MKGSTEYDQFYNKKMIFGAISTGRAEALQWSIAQLSPSVLSLDMNRTDEQWIDRRLKNIWIRLAAKMGHINILEFLRVRFGDEFWMPASFSVNLGK